MSHPNQLTRRTLLRAGSAGMMLPIMTPLLPGLARAEDGFPQRFLVFTHGQGTLLDSIVQAGATETNWELGSVLAPLARHKERLLVMSGVDDATNVLDTPYNGHTRCRLHTLTAQGMQWTAGDSGVFPSSAGGPSIDQVVADRWSGLTSYRSLEHGVKVGTLTGNTYTWRGVGQPALPEDDPQLAFDRLFSDLVSSTPEEVAARKVRRERVLDAVQRQFDHLRPKLDADDRTKLDIHQQSLEDVRQTLQGAALGDACGVPGGNWSSNEVPDIASAQIQLLTMALACDMTRVGSLAIGGINEFPWLDVDFPTGWHDAVHAGPVTDALRTDLTTSFAWFAEQLAQLMDALDAVPEGTGTLLDHTLILYANVFSDGSIHDHVNKTYVLAGGAPGLQMDRFLDLGGTPHGDVHTSVLNTLGFDDTEFGNPDFCTGAVGGLR